MAFIAAVIIWFAGSALAIIVGFAGSMSDDYDEPNQLRPMVWRIVFVSWGLAGVVASSHWWWSW